MGNEDIINFEEGKLVYGRWRVLSKLGAGGCGAVFKVKDEKNKNFCAALKAEKNDLEDGGVLKLEVEVFRKLQERKHTVQMLGAGKRSKYSFIVMTLCDKDLMSIKRNMDIKFSEGTMLRVGVHALYAIKQLHEIGYVHRDVKPGNMVIGMCGRERKMVFLIDYGMVRGYLKKDDKGNEVLRPARKKVLLRGTLRYCSLSVHERKEQGRVDDLWSLIYMLVELYKGLPWNRDSDEKEIKRKKESLADDVVFKGSPPEFLEIAKYLRPLKYSDRPDYFKIYEHLMAGVRRCNTHFTDQYEWEKKDAEKMAAENSKMTELDLVHTCVEPSERERKQKKSIPADELDYKVFPNTHPDCFKEVIIKI